MPSYQVTITNDAEKVLANRVVEAKTFDQAAQVLARELSNSENELDLIVAVYEVGDTKKLNKWEYLSDYVGHNCLECDDQILYGEEVNLSREIFSAMYCEFCANEIIKKKMFRERQEGRSEDDYDDF